MPFVLFTDTLTQNSGETDTDFNTRVQTYISDQQYYFEQAGGSLPISSTPGQGAYLGFPPGCPPQWYQGNSINSVTVWDGSQMVRQVTLNYDNTYYYKYSGTVPPLPPPSPLPTAGNIAMFGPLGTLTSTAFAVDTGAMTVDFDAYQLKNLLDGVDPQDAVTVAQLGAAISGFVSTVNGVAPTLGNIQLTVSNSGTAGTLQWNLLDLEIPQADTNTTGLLSDTDWNTFNNKQPAGSYLTAADVGVTVQAYSASLTSWAAVTRAAGFDTFAATPSSANLRSLLTDETGTGAAVFADGPTLANPIVGTQAANDNSTKAASTAYTDAKVADAINNGTTTVAPSQNAVYDAIYTRENTWQTLMMGNALLVAASVTANDVYWHSFQTNAAPRQNVASSALAPAFKYIRSSDFVSAIGLTPKLRLKVSVAAVNDVAPAATITPGLYPCAGPTSGTTGGAGVRTYASGTVVTGSDAVSFASPAADSFSTNQVTSSFSFPADGLYSIGSLVSTGLAANSAMHIIAEVQLRFE